MKTKRMLVIGAGLALTLALGTGFAAAQTDASGGGQPPAATSQAGDHATLHEQMRSQMTAEQQAQCDANHAQMGNGHDGSMMEGGSGGMGNGHDGSMMGGGSGGMGNGHDGSMMGGGSGGMGNGHMTTG